MDTSPESLAKLLDGRSGSPMAPEEGVAALPPDEDDVIDELMAALKVGDGSRVKGALRAHRSLMRESEQNGDVEDPTDEETD